MSQSTENQFIRTCIQQIEGCYADTQKGAWRQRELERFQRDLSDRTGVRLSLSTLKRLWKNQFAQLPHAATLDALAQFLDYQDWHDFKARQGPPGHPPKVSSTRKTSLILSAAIIVFGVALVVVANLGFSPSDRPVRILGDVGFEVDKTVASGVPNTILFRYDLGNVEADSFFIQQSWNRLLRRSIDPADEVYASIYYIPGFHRGKLFANDSIIAIRRVHILTDGWLPYARHNYEDPEPIYLKPLEVSGALTVEEDDFAEKVRDMSNDWVITYTNVADFRATSDSFELSAALQLSDLLEEACSYVEMRILTEEHIFYVQLTNRGCEAGLELKVGETILDGQKTDLSAFGADLEQWNDLRLRVENKHASVFLNGVEVRHLSYEQSFGGIKGIAFRFTGRGLVDYVTLRDGKGDIAYHDDFEVATIQASSSYKQ